jgi:hypothetical protein
MMTIDIEDADVDCNSNFMLLDPTHRIKRLLLLQQCDMTPFICFYFVRDLLCE